MTTPARKVVEGRGAVRAARPPRKRPMAVTQPRDVIPHKRARIGPENVSSPRAKSSRSKKGVPMSKPRKSAPPRVRKTNRNLPKTEPSSPGHPANRDIDYDEIPPSTTILNPPTTHECNPPASTTGGPISTSGVLQTRTRHGRTTHSGPPTARPGLENEMAIDKQANGVKLKQADARLIQPPPPEVILEDDDPIQSFSSSLCESLSVDDDSIKSGLHVSAAPDASVISEPLPEADAPNLLDVAPTATVQTCNTQSAVTEGGSDITIPKTDELSSNAKLPNTGDDKVRETSTILMGPPSLPSSFLNHK
ncbi:hypothetical protein BGW80DRAFT_843423 [Lactifluus volemus]|nr:hypothetical protein BGW80DRAFT_843423 [Lactifluus volemus]